ncbi:hypothetical protein [Stenomitos frigidus]|uniref:hypothetical protein n=1 Tax=Stenomitos frigidus TaxID=1886765 RepID=UPI0015E6CD40|nr:hypothetical protein [Stenomitos frigidus]
MSGGLSAIKETHQLLCLRTEARLSGVDFHAVETAYVFRLLVCITVHDEVVNCHRDR